MNMARVFESIDVNVPVREAYDRWTHFESFPQFFEFVESVTRVDDTHSHWKVKIAGAEREFDAESEMSPNAHVAWTSVGGDEKHAGLVTFDELSETTTRITVQLDWVAERLLEKAGAIFGVDDHVVKKDLRRFRDMAEGRPGAVTD
jgi:uncharacterized membrane protein